MNKKDLLEQSIMVGNRVGAVQMILEEVHGMKVIMEHNLVGATIYPKKGDPIIINKEGMTPLDKKNLNEEEIFALEELYKQMKECWEIDKELQNEV